MQSQATTEPFGAIATIVLDPAGEFFLGWPLTAHPGSVTGKTVAPVWHEEHNALLDHPLQAMVLATAVAASLGLLARRTQPGVHRGLSSDPPQI